jgi:hypothetical protein
MTVGDSPVILSANYHLLNRLSAASDPANGASVERVAGICGRILSRHRECGAEPDAAAGLQIPALGGRFERYDSIGRGDDERAARGEGAARSHPVHAPAGVGNAAGQTPQTGVAPGSIISIFGVNLATDTVVAPDGMLPQTLGGLTVRVGDRLLPLFSFHRSRSTRSCRTTWRRGIWC